MDSFSKQQKTMEGFMKTTSAIVITVSMILGSAAAQAGTQFDQTTVTRPFRETSVISCEAKLKAQYKKNAMLQCEVEYLECLEAGNDSADCKDTQLACKEKVEPSGVKQDGGAGDGVMDKVDADLDGDSLIVGNFKLMPGKKLFREDGGSNSTAYVKSDQIIRTVSCEAQLKGAEEHFQSLQRKIEDLKTSKETIEPAGEDVAVEAPAETPTVEAQGPVTNQGYGMESVEKGIKCGSEEKPWDGLFQ
jgi:hypothetical protein